jgi:hypothetical protein
MYGWGKQKHESKQAYAAFRAYLGESSIRKTARRLGRSRQLLERWSVKWRWVEKAEAYHADQERWNVRLERVRAGLPLDHRKREASEEVIRLAETICDNGLGSERARAWTEEMERLISAHARGELDDEDYEVAAAPLIEQMEDMETAIEEAAAEPADVLEQERQRR